MSRRNQRNTSSQLSGRAFASPGTDDTTPHVSQPPPPMSREEKISKQVSWVLRYGAVQEGLRIDENGYINCGDLLSWHQLYRQAVTLPELVAIAISSKNPMNNRATFELIPLPSLSVQLVEDSDAHPLPLQPFTSTEDEAYYTPTLNPQNPAHHLIRAYHGHSIPLDRPVHINTSNLLSLQQLPSEVVHGTSSTTLLQILQSGGLKPMNGKPHVYFFAHDALLEELAIPPKKWGQRGEEAVGAIRRDVDLLIYVDAQRSMKRGGLRWWRGKEGVLMTGGDGGRVVGLEWWTRVIRRGSGEVVWRPAVRWKEEEQE